MRRHCDLRCGGRTGAVSHHDCSVANAEVTGLVVTAVPTLPALLSAKGCQSTCVAIELISRRLVMSPLYMAGVRGCGMTDVCGCGMTGMCANSRRAVHRPSNCYWYASTIALMAVPLVVVRIHCQDRVIFCVSPPLPLLPHSAPVPEDGKHQGGVRSVRQPNLAWARQALVAVRVIACEASMCCNK